jgi:hypothetical protein
VTPTAMAEPTLAARAASVEAAPLLAISWQFAQGLTSRAPSFLPADPPPDQSPGQEGRHLQHAAGCCA